MLHFPLTYLVLSASAFFRSASRFSLAALGVELLALSRTPLLGVSAKTDSFMCWLSLLGAAAQ